MTQAIRDIDPALVLWDELLPGGAKCFHVLKRGTTLRLVDEGGSMGVAALLYNADDTAERLNVADTAKIQFNCYVSRGRVLYSDMGRVLVSITSDTCGHHDLLCGGSNRAVNHAKFGEHHPNTRDNFVHALGRLGMGKRDIMPHINLFSRVRVGAAGELEYVEGGSRPGCHVDLRAEMNVLVVLSNTPHVLHPGTVYDPRPVRLIAWKSPPPGADDLCAHACPEVERGLRNTQDLFL